MDNKILVLAFGNDIIGDDGAALEAAKILENEFSDIADFEHIFGGGLEVLDFIENREKVLILDSICTESNPPGTVVEFGRDAFGYANISSPHYIGLPEVLKIFAMFEINLPDDIRILAIEIEAQNNIIEGLSPIITEKLPDFTDKAREVLNEWKNEGLN